MDQLDLFSKQIEPPGRRRKSSANLGGKRERESTALNPGKDEVASASEQQPARGEVAVDDPLPSPDLTPRQVLEQWLREQAVPYLDAEQVKAGLPNRNRLQLFDFVVHREEASWLVAACHDNPSDRLVADLREWERILGPVFVGAIARVDDDGGMTLRTVEGEHVDLA
jgi:hypothetical protein